MKLFSTLAAVAAVVAAQGPDGGVSTTAPAAPTARPAVTAAPPATPPAAPARPATAVAPPPAPTPDAGTPPQPQPPQPPPTAQPKVVTVENGAKVQALESKLEQQNQKLDSAVHELEQLRAQQAAQAQAEQQRHARAEAQKQAATQMGAIDQQLLTGDTSQALQAFSSMESTLGPAARANLEFARQALANSDVANARAYLSRAAADAQAGR